MNLNYQLELFVHNLSKTESLENLEIVNLLRRHVLNLSKDDQQELLSKFDIEEFKMILPFTLRAFKFYKSKQINLTQRYKMELIIHFIKSPDLIIECYDDDFVPTIEKQSDLLFGVFDG